MIRTLMSALILFVGVVNVSLTLGLKVTAAEPFGPDDTRSLERRRIVEPGSLTLVAGLSLADSSAPAASAGGSGRR